MSSTANEPPDAHGTLPLLCAELQSHRLTDGQLRQEDQLTLLLMAKPETKVMRRQRQNFSCPSGGFSAERLTDGLGTGGEYSSCFVLFIR